MRNQILAVATIFLLAAGATTGAMASGHRAGYGGSHVRGFHVTGMHGVNGHRARLARARRPESWREGGSDVRGGFIDLGPLGITAACGSYRSKHYCGQGYSVSAWSY
jgi:hypothetical protein